MKQNYHAGWLAHYTLPFSWSHTRASVFEHCRRLYYWSYYAPFGGNTPSETGDRALLYTLGKLTNVPALLGRIVHTIASDSLAAAMTGRPWERAIVTSTAGVLLHKAVTQSRKAAKRSTSGRNSVRLREHYEQQVVDEGELLARLNDAVAHLLDHPLYIEVAAKYAEISQLDTPQRYQMGGVWIFSVPDVLLHTPEGEYRIIDWKSGSGARLRQEETRAQLNGYALCLGETAQARAGHITCEVGFTASGNTLSWQVTEADLEQTRSRIMTSISRMQACLSDAALNQAERSAFPPRAEAVEKDDSCMRCVFCGVCRDLETRDAGV